MRILIISDQNTGLALLKIQFISKSLLRDFIIIQILHWKVTVFDRSLFKRQGNF